MSTKGNIENTQSRILIVDDNRMSRKVITFRLLKQGYSVVEAETGVQALEIVSANGADLIFLDLKMVGMSGQEVLQTLQADDALKTIPVVVVSGIDDDVVVAECMTAGARSFLHKPVKTETLQEIVNDLVGPVDQGAAAPATEPDISATQLFNGAAIDQLTGDYGAKKTGEFVDRFDRLSPGQVIAIRGAAANGDHREMARVAGVLKGGARTLGLVRIAAACRSIEQAIANGNDDAAKMALDALGDHLTPSLDALKAHTGAG